VAGAQAAAETLGAARAHHASQARRSSPQLQHERRFTSRRSQNDTRRVILPIYLLRMALPLGSYSLLKQATTDLDTSRRSSLQHPRTQISTDIPSTPSYLTPNSRFNYVLVLERVAPTSPLPCRSNEPPEDGRNAASAILNTTRSAWRRSRPWGGLCHHEPIRPWGASNRYCRNGRRKQYCKSTREGNVLTDYLDTVN